MGNEEGYVGSEKSQASDPGVILSIGTLAFLDQLPFRC
jgi:hypothetical protein